MSNVFFISDLHIGHKNIHNLRNLSHTFQDEEHHRQVLRERWNKEVSKRDLVWILGDVCFKEELLPFLGTLNGNKKIILGNHDVNGSLFTPYASWVGGLARYKGYWLSHAPLHPSELRGKNNIHGHVHYATLYDNRYFNVCPENIGMCPIPFEEIVKRCPVGRE